MKTMVLDTSTQTLLLAFLDDDKVITKKEILGNNNHSENLIKTIEAALKEENLEVRDFGRIICGIGPGRYTGLRVSLTVAKVFAWTLNIPLYTISSLDIIASGYFKTDGEYIIKTKAKKDHVYYKQIRVEDQKITTIIEDRFATDDDFLRVIKQVFKVIDEENICFAPENIINERLEKVTDINGLEPNYLRSEL